MGGIIRRISAFAPTLVAVLTACGGDSSPRLLGPRPTLTPAPSGGVTLTVFPIPQPQSGPLAIAVGPDANLWFTESVGEAIARVTVRGAVTEFAVPGASQHDDLLYGIAPGPNNTIWAADVTGGALFASTTAGVMRRVVLGSPSTSGPSDLAPDSSGNLWVADGIGDAIEELAPDGNRSRFLLPARNSAPFWIVASGGDQWFTEEPGKVGRLDANGQLVAEYRTPRFPAAHLLGIASARGAVWYADAAGDSIGEVDSAGTVQEFALPTPAGEHAGPFLLAPDAAGNVWFTYVSENGDADAIGRLDSAQGITMLTLPSSAAPSGIVYGPDGNVWFLEAGLNQVVRLSNPSAFGNGEVRKSRDLTRADRRFVRLWLTKVWSGKRAR